MPIMAVVQAVHRKKDGDAVLDLVHHPTLPLLATGGGDALVKLYNTR